MPTCGNCGKPVTANDVICPHCNALIAAWSTPASASQPSGYEQPEYARPPVKNASTSSGEADQPSPRPFVGDSGVATAPASLANSVPNKEVAAELVNTIHAYARKREAQANQDLVNTIRAYIRQREAQAHVTMPQSARATPGSLSTGRDGETPLHNVVLGIGIVMIVILLIMWAIVVTMVVTDMLQPAFIATTIVLTLAFKPTMNSFRRAFRT